MSRVSWSRRVAWPHLYTTSMSARIDEVKVGLDYYRGCTVYCAWVSRGSDRQSVIRSMEFMVDVKQRYRKASRVVKQT